MAQAKDNATKKGRIDVDKYIAKFPRPVQKELLDLRKTIHKAAPKAEELMSYGAPAFKQNKNLVLYAAFSEHIGFYPSPSAIIKFKKELSKYDLSKGTVRFPLGTKIPFDLIERIVKFKVQEDEKSN
ncbi:MAG: DUF1801 domain-containing protein [archaeon]